VAEECECGSFTTFPTATLGSALEGVMAGTPFLLLLFVSALEQNPRKPKPKARIVVNISLPPKSVFAEKMLTS